MSRKVQVKNRQPAPIQITAEQILREANDRVVKEDKAPRVHITDPEELMQVGTYEARPGSQLGGWGVSWRDARHPAQRESDHSSPPHTTT